MAQEVQVGPFAQCVHHGVALGGEGRGGEGREELHILSRNQKLILHCALCTYLRFIILNG